MDNTVATIYSALGIDWTKVGDQHAVGARVPLRRHGGPGRVRAMLNDEIAPLSESMLPTVAAWRESRG